MTTLPTADDQAALLATDALDGAGLSLVDGSDETVATILAVVIPHIRADERRRCIDAVRGILPPPGTALYSVGYRAGHQAARDAAIDVLEQLPIIGVISDL